MNEGEIWEAALGQLQMQMTQATFDTWIRDTRILSMEGNHIILGTKSAFAKDWIENRLFTTIKRTLSNILGESVDIRVEIDIDSDPPVRAAEAAGSSPPAGHSPDEADPEPDQAGVELFNFDPTQRGFVMTSNYATRFWQPYLNQFCFVSPFALWVTLKSFAYHADKRDTWPSINTLAHICGNGDRNYILGRAASKGKKQVVGALEVLENERIVYVKKFGTGRKVDYKFRVLENLPLLTPAQVERLSHLLKTAHHRWIEQSTIDYEEWQQLTLPNLMMAAPIYDEAIS